MSQDREKILQYVSETRGIDFSTYRHSFVDQQLQKRFSATGVENGEKYWLLLQENPDEVKTLLDALIVQYSIFFRHPLTFEILHNTIFPLLFTRKKESNDHTLRIWSAGCATGEEPYSVAILLCEWMEYENEKWDIHIFATDMDKKAIEKAKTAVYSEASLRNVKYGVLQKYFVSQSDIFRLRPEIPKMVLFSVYDLLDKKSYVPPESIFGNFDLVFCRNVLIYFSEESRNSIFKKLFRSLSKQGFLILGEPAVLPEQYRNKFRQVYQHCKIYEKNVMRNT